MKPRIVLAAALAVATLAGCIPSEPIDRAQMDATWLLTDVSAVDRAAAAPVDPDPGEGPTPTRWIIRRQDSLILATISIVRAVDRIEQGATEVAFSVSPGHTAALVDVLQDARVAVDDLRELIDAAPTQGRDQWADSLADVLARVEFLTRRTSTDPNHTGDDEPLGMAAEPVLDMIAGMLGDAGGGSLGELTKQERGRLRDVLTAVVLRLGFQVAGRDAPDTLRQDVADTMRRADRREPLQQQLAETLERAIADAPPAARARSRRETVLTVLRWLPRGIEAIQMLLRQWDRVDRLVVETVPGADGTAVAVTLVVSEGREVRLENVVALMPVIAVRGHMRAVVHTGATEAGATVVSFGPGDQDGAIEVRYDGLIYALARLFAFPLASGPLREVRVATHSPPQGRQMLHVTVLSEADGDRDDPRRALVIQDTEVKRLVREALSVRPVTRAARTAVSYITPHRRWTYVNKDE